MNNEKDFVIKNGVLKKYKGDDPEVVIPDGVKSIGEFAFCFCRSLTSITIPDSVTSLGKYAFSNCTSLTSITIPDSVTSIGEFAFAECTSLASITVSDKNKVFHSAGNCLIETESKTLIAGCKTSIIPSDGTVTSIGERAFSHCESLVSVPLPGSLTSIGNLAFYGCANLTSVIIPDGVKSIGECAFDCCTSLTSVAIPGSVTSIGIEAFHHCDSLTSITVDEKNAFYRVEGNRLIENATGKVIARMQRRRSFAGGRAVNGGADE